MQPGRIQHVSGMDVLESCVQSPNSTIVLSSDDEEGDSRSVSPISTITLASDEHEETFEVDKVVKV